MPPYPPPPVRKETGTRIPKLPVWSRLQLQQWRLERLPTKSTRPFQSPVDLPLPDFSPWPSGCDEHRSRQRSKHRYQSNLSDVSETPERVPLELRPGALAEAAAGAASDALHSGSAIQAPRS